MYIPNPLPSGPHYTYFFKEADRPRFKIGISADPWRRRNDPGMPKGLKVYARWEFENYFAALFVEQQTIAYLRYLKFNPVRGDDWFDVDEATMRIVSATIGKLASVIQYWEMANLLQYERHILETIKQDIFEKL